jgi:hypothetical protein
VLLGTKSLLLVKLAAMGCLPCRIARGPSANSGRQKQSARLTWCANDRSISSRAMALSTRTEVANQQRQLLCIPTHVRVQAQGSGRTHARALTLPFSAKRQCSCARWPRDPREWRLHMWSNAVMSRDAEGTMWRGARALAERNL